MRTQKQCIDILILAHILLLFVWRMTIMYQYTAQVYVSYASFICEITLILNIDGHVQTLFICRRVCQK